MIALLRTVALVSTAPAAEFTKRKKVEPTTPTIEPGDSIVE